jgi:6-phosphogluconolactonase
MERPDNPAPGARVYIKQSPHGVAYTAAEVFLRLAKQSAAEDRRFRVALSGGSTPKILYDLLASDTNIFRADVPWGNIDFFFGDERWVPHDDPESNYKLANDYLFRPLDIPEANVYPMRTEGISPDESASQYATTLRDALDTRHDGEVPELDLVFLGMGDDGHTASLFPATPVVHDNEHLAAAVYVPKLSANRVTLTPLTLNAAAQVIFMVTGSGKAPALREVLEGPYAPDTYPSQVLRNSLGQVTWLVDKDAAADLQEDYPVA